MSERDDLEYMTDRVQELLAENARLRAEVEEANGALSLAGADVLLLTADLARVTSERDALREAAKALLAEMGTEPDNPDHCEGCAAETALRAAIEVCGA